MQQLHDANKPGGAERLSAGQAAQLVGELAEVFAKLAAPPPKEVWRLIRGVKGAPPEDRPPRIPNPVLHHRMSSFLRLNPGSTMGEVSQSLGVPLYAATRIVDSLLESGLADRLSDPDDRRIVRVTLTDVGLRLHETMEAHLARGIQRMMACLTPEEQGVLITLLRKVTASLKASET